MLLARPEGIGHLMPFILMTATFSRTLLDGLADWLDAAIVTVPPGELAGIPSQQDKVRRFHHVDSLLTADAVLDRRGARTLALCNTVDRAVALWEDLHVRAGDDVEVLLLHSRFLRDDRQAKEERVRRLFGPDGAPARPTILVATQVVEVGLNITSDVLHTEMAPANSLLQRAGRCARFAGETGDVFVYDVSPNARGEPNYAPYGATLCSRTRDALRARSGTALSPSGIPAEQELIDEVHGPADAELLERLQRDAGRIRALIDQGWSGDHRVRSKLIRHIDSRTVLVHDEPETLDNPLTYEGFSLWRGTLYGLVEPLVERADALGLPWALQTPLITRDEEDPTIPPRVDWLDIWDEDDLAGALIVVLHPALARYDAEGGFRTPNKRLASFLATPDADRRLDWVLYLLVVRVLRLCDTLALG